MVDISEFEDILAVSWQTRSEIDWLMQRLSELKPKRILEIGVAQGGTSGLFSRVVGDDGVVVGLDIRDEWLDPRIRDLGNHTLVLGDSHDPAIFERVRGLCDTYDFMLIDGDHSVDGVLRDTEMYLPLLRDGGLAVWHDVRLDPTEGIKQVWYRDLKRRLLGSFEHFANPYNNGYGVWYKTAVTVDAFEADALAANAHGADRRGDFRTLVGNDPTRLAAWRGLLAGALRIGDRESADAARVALALTPPHCPDAIAALRDDPSAIDDPHLAPALEALDAELRGGARSSADADRHVALSASRHGLHEVAEDRIARACTAAPDDVGLLLDRVSVLESSDALVADVATALADAVRASAAAGTAAPPALPDVLKRVMTASHLLQKHATAASLVPPVLEHRPDLAPVLVDALTNLSVLAIRDGRRGEQAARAYCGHLRDCALRAGSALDAGQRKTVDLVLSRAGQPRLAETV